MEERIRLLFIGKSAYCYERVIKSFRKEEMPASYHQVRARVAVKEALNAQPWDLIVADSHTLSLMKLSIAEIFQQQSMACPLIMIGTDISEEAAVKAMSEGACHCLDKKRLQCLPLIAKNELNHTKPSSIHCLPLDKLSSLMAVIQ